jgi:carbamoyl-phosphate synthase large subunit
VSSGSEKEKLRFLPAAKALVGLGIPLFATKGTAKYLQDHGFPVTSLDWPGEGPNDVIQAIKDGKVDFVINIPKNSQRGELTRGSLTRQAAVKFGCSLLTNMEIVSAYVQALDRCPNFLSTHEVLPLPSYRS